jgi:hypothetical protein
MSPLEYDYLKLLSVDGSLSSDQCASLLGVTAEEVDLIDTKLRKENVFYGVFPNGPLPAGYTKVFVDTTALSHIQVDNYFDQLKKDTNCIYVARGNGRYNFEFEYIVDDKADFSNRYSRLLRNSKTIKFDTNVYTNLFPQSKSLNTKMIQEKFIHLASRGVDHFDFSDSELWYVNHEGTQSYLDIYDGAEYRKTMKSGEVSLFGELSEELSSDEKKINLIDLGSGDGKKGMEFISKLGEEKINSYFPVDIQELELSQALRAHEGASYPVHPTIIDFGNLSARFPLASTETERNIYAMFGGTYGNFDVAKINTYLEPLLASQADRILVGVPIRDFVSKSDIARSYATTQIENIAFGVLRQIGFNKEEFMMNPEYPNLRMQLRWEGDCLRTFFVLKEGKRLLGLYIDPGTVFTITSSWKPSLKEFKESIEKKFAIQSIVSNRTSAIAICKKKAA